MVILGAALASAATTDIIGGHETWQDAADMLKLVVIDVRQAVVVTRLDFGVYEQKAESGVLLTLYEAMGDDGYELRDQVEAVEVEEGGFGFAGADPAWLLEPGKRYAIGAWLPAGWFYYYDMETAQPWFGEVVASLRVNDFAPPQSFIGQPEDFYYYMKVTTEDADADGDGLIDGALGGTDCDDDDPMVGEGTAEIPYDGVDQDCDGRDLTDVDGDGIAGGNGADCDDTAAEIAPDARETCGDGIDQNCDGADLACGTTEGRKIAIRTAECASASTGTSLAGLALAAISVLRRRRG